MPKYKTIVVDPPWPIKIGPDMTRVLQGSSLKDELEYQTMTEEEIKEFPINDFAEDDSIIFLWCTNSKLTNGRPCLQVGFEVLERWNFKFRTLLIWQKNSGYAIWQPFRGITEFILFGTRTHNIPPYGKYSNLFNWPNRRHSEKPAGFYQMLRSWSPKPRIDIFARNAHVGFEGWGNEYVGDGPLQEFLE